MSKKPIRAINAAPLVEVAPAPSAHSTLGASTSDRWGNCPGSVRMSVGIENKSSVYAEEGTEAHGVAATVLTTGAWPIDVTDEMREAVKVYVNYIRELEQPLLCHEQGAAPELFIEQRLDLSSVQELMFGTADAVVYLPKEKTLHVVDYKHGAGHVVDVQNNPQLQYYGLGAMLMLNRPVEKVVLTIVQPRAYHANGPIRSWELHAFDMLDFAADLKVLADATQKPNAPLKSGEWCRWCPAAAICPELTKGAQEVAKMQFGVTVVNPTGVYKPEELAAVLAKLDIFEDWATSVRNFAYQEAQAGRPIPGYKLVQKVARRKWHPHVNAVVLAEKFGGDKLRYMDMSLRTPPDVEKLLEKEQKKELESFVEKVSSGLALVPESDKRPAAVKDAKTEFAQIAGPTGSIFD